MKTSIVGYLVLGLCVAILSGGCDDPEDNRFRLSEAVDNPVAVSLTGVLGTVQLVRIDGLPIEPRDQLYNLLDGQISLTVSNPSTGTTVNLTEGELVETTPSAPGEFRVSLVEDMGQLMVVFYNETSTGAVLANGVDYEAAITVSPNDFFATESFTRQVAVQ